jgi:hypothetical protein
MFLFGSPSLGGGWGEAFIKKGRRVATDDIIRIEELNPGALSQ